MFLKKSAVCLIFLLIISFCHSAQVIAQRYTSKDLIVRKVKERVYQHTSFLQTDSFGNVPCNGMVVVDHGEAVIFDTPTNDKASEELIGWVEKTLKCKVVGVVATHFHEDCVGGLAAFHQHQIPSYGSGLTIELTQKNNYPTPKKSFNGLLEISVGEEKVTVEFNGEGHTRDNVIGYFPAEKVMFGGCLIKELKAGKGYLGDSNVNEWSATVAKVKEKYPDTKVVIPGHGKTGNIKLLDYTIELFEKK
ncbi:subclass B1 metallo-beta-lactamase [Dyadobacter luteus]|jgi:metallo-beta-lactamase class B|uniref:beta-lactamase n=1 Tax=Dyadobacter luteus TaxID=2259619 RepID=A0A3D8Y907_9BACT|nr:subclass B1 metallo-beta-lactamase [Dyadobacter luteus]REA59864.1 subclass B1 metallo-beta-lactamase [Dyadobacter luteus]